MVKSYIEGVIGIYRSTSNQGSLPTNTWVNASG